LSIDVINCRKHFWKNISAIILTTLKRLGIILQKDFGKNVQNQNSEIEAKKSVTEWWFMMAALRRGGVEARRRCS
jgi:hypothetical protein